jgi:hypothetical protein
MPTLLELPFEIRTIIWHHTATRDVYIGARFDNPRNVRKCLANLTVDLKLTCRQVKEDLASLDICYRFQLDSFSSCCRLYEILKPKIRPGTQFAVKKSVFTAPRMRVNKAMADSMDATWLAKAKKTCGMPEGSYKSVHLEGDRDNDEGGWGRVDLVWTL